MDSSIVAESATLIALPPSPLMGDSPTPRARYLRELIELAERAAADRDLSITDRIDWGRSGELARQQLDGELAQTSRRGA